ncbi:MAG: T9SS type A sorting domain-containing protein [Bacteroidia bacterium]
MKKLYWLVIMLLACRVCDGQNANIKRTWHWYFGGEAGIDFSSSTAVVDTNSAMNTPEGSACISDTSGNLLFYTDGKNVWNKLHQIMPNGTGLLGGLNGSCTQSSLIIPQPGVSNLYYLFTTDETNGYYGFRYSIVDMNLDGANGDITSQKNILLFAPCAEKLSAVNHCNDSSIWIAAHKVGTNEFCTYLLTSQGLDTVPVISAVGSVLDSMDWINPLAGQLKFSSDGRKAATPIFGLFRLELYDFDNQTGLFSNPIIISTNDSLACGVEFSFNNLFLYFTTINGKLFQFDISSDDSAIITISKTLIYNDNNYYGFGQLQKAHDGKIYVGSSTVIRKASVINYPDSAGLSCNFTDTSFNLNPGLTFLHGNKIGMPNFNCSYFRMVNGSSCNTGISEIQNNAIKVFPNPFTDNFTISLNKKEPVELTLYDIPSRKLLQQKFTTSTTINTSQLARGIYIYEVRNDKGVVKQGKVVKE